MPEVVFSALLSRKLIGLTLYDRPMLTAHYQGLTVSMQLIGTEASTAKALHVLTGCRHSQNICHANKSHGLGPVLKRSM